jgi:hypothetical protein
LPKQDLKRKIVGNNSLDKPRGLALGGRNSGRELGHRSSHMPFRAPVNFVFSILGLFPELLGRLGPWKNWRKTSLSSTFFLVHLCFYCPHLDGQSKKGDRVKLWRRRGERKLTHG